jgi:putative integral membrane protein (TIGR02587 family)
VNQSRRMPFRAPTARQSLREYSRGIAGGLLFSLPLLFTMEMWDMGLVSEPPRLIGGMFGGFLLLLGYNRYAGLRCDAGVGEVVIDSIEELGLGLLLAAGLLWVLGSIDGETRTPELVGKIVIEGLAVAIGVSVGTAQLGGESPGLVGDENSGEGDDRADGKDEKDDEDDAAAPCAATDADEVPPERGAAWFAGQMTLGLCGAVLVAANIAPTDEIGDIARGLSVGQLLGLNGLTLLVGALVLYASGFRGSHDHVHHRGYSDVVLGALATYLVSMSAAAALLGFFGAFDDNGLGFCLAETIVLCLPTAIGASAGRLLLQQT